MSDSDKASHPLVHGFDFAAAKRLTDEDREGVVWRTWLELSVAQVADVHVGTWGSNHARMAYELMGVVSNARSTAPFVALDDQYMARGIPVPGLREMDKRGRVPACP